MIVLNRFIGRFPFKKGLWLVGLLCSLAGCASDISPPKDTKGLENLQSVVGSVEFQGKPTPGAIVMFFRDEKPDPKAPRIAGIVDEDGSFEMQTTVAVGTRPGVKAGKYIVTVSWNEKVDPADKDSDDGPDRVPSIYKDPATSTLRVEIEEGDNDLDPFVLKE